MLGNLNIDSFIINEVAIRNSRSHNQRIPIVGWIDQWSQFNIQSNDIYLITIKAPLTPDKLIIRFFGKIGHLIDTRLERKVFSAVCKLKTGLEEYKSTDSYRVEQFIPSVSFSAFELKESMMIKSFANEICKIHYSKDLKEILKWGKTNYGSG